MGLLTLLVIMVVIIGFGLELRDAHDKSQNQWFLRAKTHCAPDTILDHWRHDFTIWYSIELTCRATDWYFLIQPIDGSDPYIGLLDSDYRWVRLEPTTQYKVLTKTGAAFIPGYKKLPYEVETAYLKRIIPGYVKHVQVVR